jgi:hypothetical protein
MTRALLVASLSASLLLAAGLPGPARGLGGVRSELVVSGLIQPVFATSPPGDPRLFVVERPGRIRIVMNGAVLATPFLDIQSLVGQIGEGGFLGLAFPPDYATSGLFYVYYTTEPDPEADPPYVGNDSVVARFSVTANPNVADPASRLELLFIDQPDTTHNHKAGTIAFGPDGFLWFATGDGGGGGDPNELAQNGLSLLGKMLRLDVGPTFAPGSIVVPDEEYRIPADNPFLADPGTRDEIWARGFRNPYRWSFDRETGDVWVGDVGQATWEEVNFEAAGDPGGRNYGWDIMENTKCLTDPFPTPPCNDPSLLLPLHAYDHSGDLCSITGGYVQRGPPSPINGLYFFGDYCTGQIWTLDPATVSVVDRTAELGAAAGVGFVVVGFGEGGDGTLHVVHINGSIHRILSADPECGDGFENDGDGLTDFPADPGCHDASSLFEDPQCDDGLDNDGDGDRDWDGAGVGDPDAFCAGDGWRNREKPKGCGLGLELVLAVPALLALRRWRRTAA